MKQIHVILSLLLLLLTFPTLVMAQSPTADEINAIAKHLNCPTCDTRSLDECNTLTCIQWKDQIGDLMVEGYSEQEILDWYVARYGDYVLQQPPTRGLGLLAWLLPIFGLLVAIVWVGWLMRSWQAKQAVTITPATGVELNGIPENLGDDEYLRRVEQDLAQAND
ncbi:MAG: cytochrome c-type biogenesis protein [Chloroflexota bacterium]